MDHPPDSTPNAPKKVNPGLSIAEALKSAGADGYPAQFIADESGDVRCVDGDHLVNAAALAAEKRWRIEGDSDAADMTMVIAVQCPHCGASGTLILGYGPNTSAADEAVLSHLPIDRAEAGP